MISTPSSPKGPAVDSSQGPWSTWTRTSRGPERAMSPSSETSGGCLPIAYEYRTIPIPLPPITSSPAPRGGTDRSNLPSVPVTTPPLVRSGRAPARNPSGAAPLESLRRSRAADRTTRALDNEASLGAGATRSHHQHAAGPVRDLGGNRPRQIRTPCATVRWSRINRDRRSSLRRSIAFGRHGHLSYPHPPDARDANHLTRRTLRARRLQAGSCRRAPGRSPAVVGEAYSTNSWALANLTDEDDCEEH